MVTEFGKRHWAGIQYKNQYPFGAYKMVMDALDNDNGLDDAALPEFYSPDLLLVQSGSKMVQRTKVITEYHLTRVMDEERKHMLSKQHRLLKFGRPNIEKIIKKAIAEYEEMNNMESDERWIGGGISESGEQRMGDGCCLSGKGRGICVLCCGPPSMVKSVKKYASQYDIDCHFEIFEL